MLEKVRLATAGALVWLASSVGCYAQVPGNINGIGSTTHSAVTTAYAANQLFANNTSGNAVASQIPVTVRPNGTGLFSHPMVQSSGTNQPPAVTLFLFSAPPQTTGLVDYSPYLGPYAADITSGIYLGAITCSTWNKTNDGTAQYYSECSTTNALISGSLPYRTVSGQAYVFALEQIGGAYTPLSAEKHTYILSTLPDQ